MGIWYPVCVIYTWQCSWWHHWWPQHKHINAPTVSPGHCLGLWDKRQQEKKRRHGCLIYIPNLMDNKWNHFAMYERRVDVFLSPSLKYLQLIRPRSCLLPHPVFEHAQRMLTCNFLSQFAAISHGKSPHSNSFKLIQQPHYSEQQSNSASDLPSHALQNIFFSFLFKKSHHTNYETQLPKGKHFS